MSVSFLGDYNTTETVVIPFNAFSSDDPSASITVTNLANTDVHIYKDGSLTQRTSSAGVAVDVDVDGIAGNHWVTIDLSDNTDAGFYIAGSRYQVRMEGVTIDGATINAWIGAFSVGCTLRPTTAGRTLDIQVTGEVDANLTMIAAVAQRAADLAEIARYLIANSAEPIVNYVADDSLLAKMLAVDGDISEYDDNAHSQEAIATEVSLASGARYAPDASSTITTGTEDSGTWASCLSDDATAWTIGDSNGTNTIEVICEFNMGAGRIARQVDVNGYYNRSGGGGYRVLLYAWNYTTSAWVALTAGSVNTEMRDRSSDKDYVWELDAAYTDLVSVPGEVKIKFQSTRPTTQGGDVLYLDYVSVVGSGSASVSPEAIAQAVHTELDVHLKHIPLFTGNIHYVDAVAGDDGNDGHTPETALLTITAAITASAAGGMIVVKSGEYDEDGLDLNLNGLEVCCEIGTIFKNTTPDTVLTVSADNVMVRLLDVQPSAGETGIAVTGEYFRPEDVYVHKAHATSFAIAASAEHAYFTRCRCDNYTATGYDVAAPEMLMDRCYALGKGAAVRGFYLSANTADHGFYNACVSLDNATASFAVVSGADNNVFNSCVDSDGCGAVVDAGTDNAWRGFASADVAGVNGAIADAVWDEILTGATHNIPTSAGRRLRELAGTIVSSDTAQAGSTTNTIKLAAGASAMGGAYDPSLIAIVGGTGSGQSRLCLEYNGTSKVAVVDRNWKVTPDNTSEYIIFGAAGREHVNEGLAQDGTSTTITLNALASSANDAYNGQLVFIRSGTGDDQTRLITDYDGTSKIATVEVAWTTTPDATSGYIMIPHHVHTLAEINAEVDTALADYDGPTKAEMDAAHSTTDGKVDATPGLVWDEATASHTAVGSFGKQASDCATVLVSLLTRIPTTLFSGITSMANWLRLLARSDAAITTDAATELAEINANGGTGAGDFAATTDSGEARRDLIAGLKNISAGDVLTQVTAGLVAINLDHLMKTPVANNADMTVEVADGTVLSNMMSKTSDTSTFTVVTDSLEGIYDASGGSAPTVEQIRIEMDSNSTQFAAIVEDTGTTLPALIAGLGASGDGAFTGTLTVNDGSTGLENATVVARLGGVLKASGTTDSSGQITNWAFGSNTYDLAVRLDGYQPTTDTLAVSADGWAKTVSLTAISITAPASVSLCTVQFRAKLSDTAVTGAVCKAKLQGINQAADGTILSNEESSDTTDAQGVAELQLVRKDAIVKGSGIYKIWVEIDGKPVASVESTIPSQSGVLFEDLL